MWFAAATEIIVSALPIVIGLIGLGGLVFTALRYRRDDTTAVVSQQSTILDNMKTLNGELRQTVTDLRTERDELKSQVDNLAGQVEALRVELRRAHGQLSGQMTSLHEKLDDDRTS
jgi:uncharacterized coiled-coil DUF342 family protein